jgi:hypothetical protein
VRRGELLVDPAVQLGARIAEERRRLPAGGVAVDGDEQVCDQLSHQLSSDDELHPPPNADPMDRTVPGSAGGSRRDGGTVTMFGHHPWTVQDLVNGVSSGTIRLPDIQRPFVWSNAKVRDLIDSMYRGYPVGELMFWANRESGSRAIGADAKAQDAAMQVVDGQQRLTSLYAVVKGLQVWRDDYTRERIRIAFNPLTERFEVTTPAFERSPEWIADIVPVFGESIAARRDYLARLRQDPSRDISEHIEERVETAINRLNQLQNYLFQVIQIGESSSRETVAEIFVRINSEGVSLSAADFILTWMSVFWEQGRGQLETFARNSRFTPEGISQITDTRTTWTPFNPYMALDPGQVLRVVVAVGLRRGRLQDAYNALRGRNPRTREIEPESRARELARLQSGQAHVIKPLNWDEFLKVLERAGFRSREMITSQNTVLYTYALWLIGRVDFGVPIDDLREVMARWFFMSQISGRYTNSPETRIQEDISRIDALSIEPRAFIRALTDQIEAAVPTGWWDATLPDDLYTSSTSAPAYVAYIAALNILDADVLLSTLKVKDWLNPNRRTVKGIEKHHLFPKDYLKTTLGIASTRKINQVANYALVEWSDNIDISNHAPHDYWPQQVAEKSINAGRQARQEEWHALPEGWSTMDYDQFLAARRCLMARVTHEGFKRLTDPNYQPDLSRPAAEAPAAEKQLPSLSTLVASGILPAGTLVTALDAEGDLLGEITDEGQLKLGDHIYASPDIAAREHGADISDGWQYWLAYLDNEPTPFATLREAAHV